jgi:hypothetical protein
MINIEIKHYAYTRRRMGVKDSVLLLNPNTGKTIVQGSESLWGFNRKEIHG